MWAYSDGRKIVKPKPPSGWLLILKVANKALILYGGYIILSQWFMSLPGIKRWALRLFWKGFVSQWGGE